MSSLRPPAIPTFASVEELVASGLEVDAERMAVAKALGIPATPFIEVFYQAGLTTKAARDSGDISRACLESEPNKTIKSPSSLNHRYVHEDVGYGLVPLAALGRLAGALTRWASTKALSIARANSVWWASIDWSTSTWGMRRPSRSPPCAEFATRG